MFLAILSLFHYTFFKPNNVMDLFRNMFVSLHQWVSQRSFPQLEPLHVILGRLECASCSASSSPPPPDLRVVCIINRDAIVQKPATWLPLESSCPSLGFFGIAKAAIFRERVPSKANAVLLRRCGTSVACCQAWTILHDAEGN